MRAAFAFVLWPSYTLASLLNLDHFHPMTWVTNLANSFRWGKRDFGGRRLLDLSQSKNNSFKYYLRDFSKVLRIIGVLGSPLL